MAGRVRTRRARANGQICGAYARSTGKPCQAKLLLRGARCRLHGGLSSGPKTREGRQRALEAMRAGWRGLDAAEEAWDQLTASVASERLRERLDGGW
jgi:hypothetical protein